MGLETGTEGHPLASIYRLYMVSASDLQAYEIGPPNAAKSHGTQGRGHQKNLNCKKAILTLLSMLIFPPVQYEKYESNDAGQT